MKDFLSAGENCCLLLAAAIMQGATMEENASVGMKSSGLLRRGGNKERKTMRICRRSRRRPISRGGEGRERLASSRRHCEVRKEERKDEKRSG